VTASPDVTRWASHNSDGRRRIDIETLKRAHPIANVVASYRIELRRVGAALVGRCSFHQDGGHPNLHVYPSGRWICYRCDQRGDVIGFLQRMENLTFRQAVSRLNDCRAPLSPPFHRPKTIEVNPRRAPAVWGANEYQVLAAATELYANQLLTHSPALDYMARRGFPRRLLEQYRIGFAAGGGLAPYLRWRHVPLWPARRTGLIRKNGRESLAGRIVFPELRNGQPIWMTGRVLESPEGEPVVDGARYLGLPGGKPLLGWDEAIRDTREVCVVEGPTDLLALRLWGISGLALSGNAIGGDMLDLLNGFGRLYVALDADKGGREGADRLSAHFGSRVLKVHLPEGQDPGGLARLPDGEARFRAALLHSPDSSESPETVGAISGSVLSAA
jgi:DNA primase